MSEEIVYKKSLIVITGPTDSGKSAFLDSIKCVKVPIAGMRFAYADYKRVDNAFSDGSTIAIEMLSLNPDEKRLLEEIAEEHKACVFVLAMAAEKTVR